MTNTMVKSFIVTFVICVFALTSKAQLGYMYSPLDLGVAGTVNTVYGDAQSQKNTKSLDLSFTYNQTPYINYVFEAQAGNLAGGNALKDLYGRQFSNNYSAYIARAQLQAGELIDYDNNAIANVFKNFYFSTGLGLVVNNNTTNRYSYRINLYTPGEDHSIETFLPIRFGYEFKIFNAYNKPSVKIDLAYQYNYVFGDELDGFKAGNSNDIFTQFSLGVKFAIGTPTSYRKQISY